MTPSINFNWYYPLETIFETRRKRTFSTTYYLKAVGYLTPLTDSMYFGKWHDIDRSILRNQFVSAKFSKNSEKMFVNLYSDNDNDEVDLRVVSTFKSK